MKRCAILLLLIVVACSYSCAKPLFTIVPYDYFPASNTNTETARIVFLRPAEGLLSLNHLGIYDGNELIGILPSLSYFAYNAKPGKHVFGSLYFLTTDFVEADVKAGKTYYVFCGLYDAFLGLTHGKMTAIKKGSVNMPKVGGWLNKLRRAELSDAGIEYYKARRDKNGTYLIGRQGLIRARFYIDEIRKGWLEKAKITGKPGLSVEDGEEITEMIGLRKQSGSEQEYRHKPTGTRKTSATMAYRVPEAGRLVSIADIPSGRLTGAQIIDLFSNKIVKGTHTGRGFTFKRHFRSDGFIFQTSPEKGEHSGYWRTNRDFLCIKWKNKREKCVKIIKEFGKINQYWEKKSGAEVRVVTYEEFSSANE